MSTTYTIVFDRNVMEGMTIYSPTYLSGLVTLRSGHWANLKLETGGLRYWLSRVAQEEPEGWQVMVERFGQGGSWEDILRYRVNDVSEESEQASDADHEVSV